MKRIGVLGATAVDTGIFLGATMGEATSADLPSLAAAFFALASAFLAAFFAAEELKSDENNNERSTLSLTLND